MVVEVVEANLSPGNYPAVAGQVLHLDVVRVGGQPGLVRMDADGGENPTMLFGNSDGAIQRTRPGTAANSKNALQARLTGAFQHLLAVSIELVAFQMCVGIYVQTCSCLEMVKPNCDDIKK